MGKTLSGRAGRQSELGGAEVDSAFFAIVCDVAIVEEIPEI